MLGLKIVAKVFPIAVSAALFTPVNQAKCDSEIQDKLPPVSSDHFLLPGNQ